MTITEKQYQDLDKALSMLPRGKELFALSESEREIVLRADAIMVEIRNTENK